MGRECDTLTVKEEGVQEILASEDAGTWSLTPDKNFGSGESIFLGEMDLHDYIPSSPTYCTHEQRYGYDYLKFPLSMVNISEVKKAELSLYCYGLFFYDEPEAIIYELRSVNPDLWNELGITWNNMPTGELVFTGVIPKVTGKYTFDLTEIFEEFIFGNIFSIELKLESQVEPGVEMQSRYYFHSREADVDTGLKPLLKLKS